MRFWICDGVEYPPNAVMAALIKVNSPWADFEELNNVN